MIDKLYDLGIRIFVLLIKLVAWANPKARLWVKGRKDLFEQLGRHFKDVNGRVAWFHCASLGEFEQARPVIEGYKSVFPEHIILLTFFSPSGYEIRKNYKGADHIYYMAADTSNNAQKFIEIVSPVIAYFVKYEFWHNHIKELHKHHIPVISFSAIFRPQQVFFRPYGGFFRQMLKRFACIYVQDQSSYELLSGIGIKKVVLAGDTRADRVIEIAAAPKNIPFIEAFKKDRRLVVIGSAWPQDLEVFVPVLNEFDNVQVVIAPHEIDTHKLLEAERICKSRHLRYSKIRDLHDLSDIKWLIIDNIGMLSSLYAYGDIACIGGAFGKGLHNTLEAAVYGLPLFFGPKYSKFKEACDLVEAEAAFAVSDGLSFENAFKNLLQDEQIYREASAKAKNYVFANKGATEMILNNSKNLIGER